MKANGSVSEKLSGLDCLRLMASVPVGRIIYTRQALPAVELVNFAIDGGDIVIRTSPSGKLAAAARDAIVAFEADQLDTAHRSGWSVTAIGRSREVTDPVDIDRLRQIRLESWAPGELDHFIRITPGIINGRRLVATHRADDSTSPARALSTR
jgi:nitroimidazol reductase NimA-like FMN-containing flavoprotein (pyridoxamine 5'-phosphate oxidase superfamily)